jgi:hypothetical protein
MYCKGIVPGVCKEKKKKKIFVFFAARFTVSEWLMTRNYSDTNTTHFCKKWIGTALPLWSCILHDISSNDLNIETSSDPILEPHDQKKKKKKGNREELSMFG